MSLKWIWSDNYGAGTPSGPEDKKVPHAELFRNVADQSVLNKHIEKGFTPNGGDYTTEFYYIPAGCHAVTQFTNPSPRLWPESYTHYYLSAPLFIKISEGLFDNGRYKNNSVVFGLELAWAKFANGSSDENISDWKYENIHILNPALDTSNHYPYYDGELTRYGQFNQGVYIPYEGIQGYTLIWGNLHIYNTGSLDVYCSGIDFGVWLDD